MSLDVGTCVVQYIKNGGHRLGVIYKKRMDPDGWAFFDVLWVSGERSAERCDRIKTCKDIESQMADLMILRDLKARISDGVSYDWCLSAENK